MIEEIEISGQTHEIEVKPITLIFKSADIIEDVKYKFTTIKCPITQRIYLE